MIVLCAGVEATENERYGMVKVPMQGMSWSMPRSTVVVVLRY
jgi:hypothetical protein